MTMQYPNDKMLLYIGMADAYGAGVEYLKFPRDEHIKAVALLFSHYVKHPTHDINYAAYTDDTEMSVANTRVLLDNDLPYTPIKFAQAYVDEFNKEGHRNGYARSFQKFLESVHSGQEFLSLIKPYSRRNGAAMRAVPIGALLNINDVLETAYTQSSVTHNTAEGLLSSQAVAIMSHFALYESTSLTEIGQFCLDTLPMGEHRDTLCKLFTTPWPNMPVHQEPYGCEAFTTVHAVAHLLTHKTSLMSMLEQIIQWGGDADSVAAITWGIASTRYKDEVLPEFMECDLECGSLATGASFLTDLGSQLMAKFNVTT